MNETEKHFPDLINVFVFYRRFIAKIVFQSTISVLKDDTVSLVFLEAPIKSDDGCSS